MNRTERERVERGQFLRDARERRGLTQHEVARIARVTQVTVSHWEGGAVPHPAKWQGLADAYGISLAAVTRHYRDEAS